MSHVGPSESWGRGEMVIRTPSRGKDRIRLTTIEKVLKGLTGKVCELL